VRELLGIFINSILSNPIWSALSYRITKEMQRLELKTQFFTQSWMRIITQQVQSAFGEIKTSANIIALECDFCPLKCGLCPAGAAVSECVWAKQQRESWLPPCWKTAIIELIKAIWGWDYARVEREEADSWNRSEMQLFSISWCPTIVHCDNKILFILVRQVCAFNAVRRRAPERNVLLQNLLPPPIAEVLHINNQDIKW
jgi:hypothetical protein